METVTIHKAKTHLSRLLARVEAGEEIVLARGDAPVAKLVPYTPSPLKPTRRFGLMKGNFPAVGPEVFAPMSDEDLDALGL